MIYKTRSIVFTFIRYRESSIIVKIYTERFGLKSFIVNGVRSKKAKTNHIAMYQPLSLLDTVIYHKESSNIHRISEAKLLHPFQTISLHPFKTTIAIFITEILSKAIKEEEENPQLFHFLWQSFITLDQLTEHFENFHIQFMCQLPDYLGFGFNTHQELANQLLHFYPEDPVNTEKLKQVIDSTYQEYIPLNRHQRHSLLNTLIKFYQLHLENFGQVKSLEVLSSLY
ncbi:DNA repair protein RecO [Rapidithrix thailandica]|uniref:DNA repair protein RecO n=1 Tax=Rapidithrix thailandica TaxID=413964 RepID=A0AAW9RXN9_9BACT